jgi:CheY-like chemotaxis protein
MSQSTRIVLCVDDDPDDREVVCYTIGVIDPTLQVEHAADGVEALSFLSKAKEQDALPCLVILDINMPRMDGKQTLAEIKKDEELNDIPIVVFSTSNNPADKKYCEHYGVELITKPQTMPHMHHEVQRLLQPCVEG